MYEDSEVSPSSLDMTRIATSVSRNARAAFRILAAVAALYTLGVIVYYLLAPTSKITSIDFRLEFPGADDGRYPNGVKFDPSEITSTPVLMTVYRNNRLQDHVPFESFKNSIFVMQKNDELDALIIAYKARLADPKLSPLDRERIQAEFDERKAALKKATYSINYATLSGLKRIRRSMREKVLRDVLTTWAAVATTEKGVTLLDVPVLSPAILDTPDILQHDYLVAFDLLRTRIANVMRSADAILEMPGANVVRGGASRRSLPEIQAEIRELLNIRIRPAIQTVVAGGLANDSTEVLSYVTAQASASARAADAVRRRAQALRDAVAVFSSEANISAARTQPVRQETSEVRTEDAVAPQLDSSFLQRIIDLTRRGGEVEYRQKLVEELKDTQIALIPLEAEESFYRDLLAAVTARGLANSASPQLDARLRARLRAALAEGRRLTASVQDLHRAVSETAGAASLVYTITSPARARTESAVSLARAAVIGVVLLALLTPLIFATLVFRDLLLQRDGAASSETVARGA